MVFNATFNNISVTSWQSVLLVEETGLESPKITSAAKKKPKQKTKKPKQNSLQPKSVEVTYVTHPLTLSQQLSDRYYLWNHTTVSSNV